MLADHLFFIIPTAAATPGLALIFLAFVVGTALGSFVQAAALRLNRDEDIVFVPVSPPQLQRSPFLASESAPSGLAG